MLSSPRITDVKARLRSGSPFFALHSGGSNPDLVEILARTDCDAIYVDCERGPIDLGGVTAMRRAAHAAGCPVLLRPHTDQAADLVRYLDTGVDGLICPRIEKPADIAAIIGVIRYARGARTASTAVIAQIESAAAVENLDELLAVDSVDAFFVGPNDIAWGLGCDATAEPVQTLVARAIRQGAEAGRTIGLPVDPQSVQRWSSIGARYFSARLPALFQGALQGMRASVSS